MNPFALTGLPSPDAQGAGLPGYGDVLFPGHSAITNDMSKWVHPDVINQPQPVPNNLQNALGSTPTHTPMEQLEVMKRRNELRKRALGVSSVGELEAMKQRLQHPFDPQQPDRVQLAPPMYGAEGRLSRTPPIPSIFDPNDPVGSLERINAERERTGTPTPVGVHDLSREAQQAIANTLEPQTPSEDTYGDQMYRSITHTRPAWAQAPGPVMRAPRTWDEQMADLKARDPAASKRLQDILKVNEARRVHRVQMESEARKYGGHYKSETEKFFDRSEPRHKDLLNQRAERMSKVRGLASIKRANRMGRLSARKGGDYKETRNAALAQMQPELRQQELDAEAAKGRMNNMGILLSSLSAALGNTNDPETQKALQDQIQQVMGQMMYMRSPRKQTDVETYRDLLPPDPFVERDKERTDRPKRPKKKLPSTPSETKPYVSGFESY